jgi:hypothetical protein
MPHGIPAAGRGTAGAGSHNLRSQCLHGLGFGEGQAGLQLFRDIELAAGQREIAFLRVNLGGDVMRLGAARMITQHLRHHLLRLGEMTALRRRIHILHARIHVREHRGRDGERQQHQRNPVLDHFEPSGGH